MEALEGLEGLLDADAVEAAPPKQRSGKAGSSSGKAGSGKAGSKASSSGGKAGSKASGSKDSGEGSVLDADDGWSVGAVDDGWMRDILADLEAGRNDAAHRRYRHLVRALAALVAGA